MDYDLVPEGRGRNYTGILTRSIVYGFTLFLFLAGTLVLLFFATCSCFVEKLYKHFPFWVLTTVFRSAFALTIASISLPNWLRYHDITVCLFPAAYCIVRRKQMVLIIFSFPVAFWERPLSIRRVA
jgi:hypothetical protein